MDYRPAAIICVVALLLHPALADIPVHCVHRDILGKWQLFLAENDGLPTSTCGHHVPDRIMTMPHHNVGPLSPPFKIKRVLDVELRNPNIVIGPSGSSGTWTTIYDEGMELTIDGWQYFTFFRYTPKAPNVDPTKVESFHWHCNETVAGWYHPVTSIGTAERPRFVSSQDGWGCFVASLKQRLVPADTVEGSVAAEHLGQTSTGEPVLSSTVHVASRFAALSEELAMTSETLFFEDRATAEKQRDGASSASEVQDSAPLMLLDLQSSVQLSTHDVLHALHAADADALIRMVDAVNSDGGLWQARVPTELLGSSVQELKSKLGTSTTGKVRVPSHSKGAEAARRIHGSTHTQPVSEVVLEAVVGGHKAVLLTDTSSYPAQLDWSTKDGGKYVTGIIDQRACGSCYAISAIDAISSRARIRSPALAAAKFALAPESIVRCSVYNQGCDGGYPYLVGKSAFEVGVVENSCMTYSATQTTCPGKVDCPHTVKGFDYGRHWKLLQSATSAAPARFAEKGLVQRKSHHVRGEGALSPGGGSGSSENSLLELQSQTVARAAAAAELALASARGSGVLGEVARADLSGEIFLQEADAESEAALQQAFGRVGPLGEDRSTPNFRAQVPKLRADSSEVSSIASNTFAESTGRLTISRYEYIGGYYGAGSESLMIKELQDGPIVVAFNSPGTLYMYKGGIFTHTMAPDVTSVDITPISRWEKTNHAVMCVGYGSDTVGGREIKWWKMKNSWGPGFGEGGYFRVVRGIDMLAIESMPVVIDI